MRSTDPRFLTIAGIATVLGVFSTLLAYSFQLTTNQAHWWRLFALNISYWYAWAVLAPLIFRLSRRFRFDRRGWGRAAAAHLAAAALTTLAHVMMTVLAQLLLRGAATWASWYAEVRRTYWTSVDWEMMTVLDDRGGEPRPPLPLAGARARALGGAPAGAAGRSPAPGPAAPAAPPLPLQHAARHLGPDAHRPRGRRPHGRAARGPAAQLPAGHGPGNPAEGRARPPPPVPRHRTTSLPRPSNRAIRHPRGDAGRASAQPHPAAAGRERARPRHHAEQRRRPARRARASRR